MIVLCMATLACWSSDTAFIQLTSTPAPTATSPAVELNTRFQVGESVLIAGQGVASIYLTESPEPVTRRNRVPGTGCYPGTTVVVLAVAVTDGITYYQVACNNTPGWLAESFLGAA